jgi:hypothetical protein
MLHHRFWYDLRHKENKTEVDNVLLNYHNVIAVISEILVDESKSHISSENAVKEIREYMNKNIIG